MLKTALFGEEIKAHPLSAQKQNTWSEGFSNVDLSFCELITET